MTPKSLLYKSKNKRQEKVHKFSTWQQIHTPLRVTVSEAERVLDRSGLCPVMDFNVDQHCQRCPSQQQMKREQIELLCSAEAFVLWSFFTGDKNTTPNNVVGFTGPHSRKKQCHGDELQEGRSQKGGRGGHSQHDWTPLIINRKVLQRPFVSTLTQQNLKLF